MTKDCKLATTSKLNNQVTDSWEQVALWGQQERQLM